MTKKFVTRKFLRLDLTKPPNYRITTQNRYSQLIRNYFVLYLDRILTTEIHEMINHNEFALYQAFQTYLMFTESLHHNDDVIRNWFSQYWKKNTRPTQKNNNNYIAI
ncbi:ImcF-related family protein [Coxiella-like endosymbiont]|uniref:ImcF-related family protein n=1 Tax=Coxiella-like endosymbiont TaxID=1592897 RepID=UPI0034E205EA